MPSPLIKLSSCSLQKSLVLYISHLLKWQVLPIIQYISQVLFVPSSAIALPSKPQPHFLWMATESPTGPPALTEPLSSPLSLPMILNTAQKCSLPCHFPADLVFCLPLGSLRTWPCHSSPTFLHSQAPRLAALAKLASFCSLNSGRPFWGQVTK